MKDLNKYIKESILDDEEVLIDDVKKALKESIFIEELRALVELSNKRNKTLPFDEDALGNKLEVGDLVYIRIGEFDGGYYRLTDRHYAIIYDIDNSKKAPICCYLGIDYPNAFNKIKDDILSGKITKEMLLKNPMRYNDVGREGTAIKLKNFSPHQVFLVKKAKNVNIHTIHKLMK